MWDKYLIANFALLMLLLTSSLEAKRVNARCIGAMGEAGGLVEQVVHQYALDDKPTDIETFLEGLEPDRIRPAVERVMQAYSETSRPSNPFLEEVGRSQALSKGKNDGEAKWLESLDKRAQVILTTDRNFHSLTDAAAPKEDEDGKRVRASDTGLTMIMAPHAVGIVHTKERGSLVIRFATGFDTEMAAEFYPNLVRQMDLVDQMNDRFFAEQTHFPDFELVRIQGQLSPDSDEETERLGFVSPRYEGRFESEFSVTDVNPADLAWAEALHFLYGSVDVMQIRPEENSGFRNTVLANDGRFINFGPPKPFPHMGVRLDGDPDSLGTRLPERYPPDFDTQLTRFILEMKDGALEQIPDQVRMVCILRAEIMLADMAIRSENGEKLFLED